MPHLKVCTNVSKDEFTKDFLNNVVTKIAEIAKLPEEQIGISVSEEVFFHKGGFQPAASLTYSALSGIDEESNTKYTEALYEAFSSVGIDKMKMAIVFRLEQPENVAHGGVLVKHKVKK